MVLRRDTNQHPPQEVQMDTITLPKRSRDGSFSESEVVDALDTLDALEDPREAVVVVRDAESENAARNRARLLANAMHEHTGIYYSAHAVPNTEVEGKWIGAVSVRSNQNPVERTAPQDRPDDAPSMRDLRAAASYLKIKGRSKMDYDELAGAVHDTGSDLASWKGYAADTANA
jgi:hypothetical protein